MCTEWSFEPDFCYLKLILPTRLIELIVFWQILTEKSLGIDVVVLVFAVNIEFKFAMHGIKNCNAPEHIYSTGEP